LNRKVKKSDNQQQQQTPIINENKENLLNSTNKPPHYHHDNESGGFDYSSSVVSPSSLSKKSTRSPRTSSPKTHDKNRSTLRASGDPTSKIHVDVSLNPTDKLMLTCDSSEPSPRDLTDAGLSSVLPHKVKTFFY
jgi:hypothetical protein